MAYTPTEWKTGDVITAEKLNNMEDGIENAILVVHANDDASTGVGTLDKTWQTIYDAIVIGKPACIVKHVEIFNKVEEEGAYEADFYWIDAAGYSERGYGIRDLSNTYWMTDSPDGYPSSTSTPEIIH